MNESKSLSIIPFYGGKSKMAHFISDRLDYAETETFVTAFGGACRVLLNKRRHPREVYNDFSSGLCALIGILANPDTADEFIQRLYYDGEHSQAQFDWAKEVFDFCETDFEQKFKRDLRAFLIQHGVCSAVSANKFIEYQWLQGYQKFLSAQDKSLDEKQEKDLAELQSNQTMVENRKALVDLLSPDEGLTSDYRNLFKHWFGLREQKECDALPRPRDMSDRDISDMELALATYIVFSQSRDGRGEVWSKEKFNSLAQFRQRVLKLHDCARRLEGVEVHQIDAMRFFRNYGFTGEVDSPEDVKPLLNPWKFRKDVMVCCDPSYISPISEEELLKDIDVEKVDSLSDAIMMKYDGKKMPKNLGDIYAMSFGYEQQEMFVRSIQDAKCKMLICNYDLVLYNKYLNERTGWKREVFETTTSVGNKKDNKRLEVIWYNY